jgi:hypothetical protein
VTSGEIRDNGSPIPFQLPLPPMRVLAIGIELAPDVAINRPQHPDPACMAATRGFSIILEIVLASQPLHDRADVMSAIRVSNVIW